MRGAGIGTLKRYKLSSRGLRIRHHAEKRRKTMAIKKIKVELELWDEDVTNHGIAEVLLDMRDRFAREALFDQNGEMLRYDFEDARITAVLTLVPESVTS